MQFGTYLAHVQDRLFSEGFDQIAVPAGLSSRIAFGGWRMESWGRLVLTVVSPLKSGEPLEPQKLVGELGDWAQELCESGQPCYVVVVFPSGGSLPDDVSSSIMALRQENPEHTWGVIPWVADLEVELVDRHVGFPEVGHEVARAVAEVPEDSTKSVWRTPEHQTKQTRNRWARFKRDVPATRIIFASTVAFYTLVAFSSFGLNLLQGPSVGSLIKWGANLNTLVLLRGEQWRVLTYMFLHANLLHLFFNMWALWYLGRYIETLYGTLRMVFIYFAAGVAGGIVGVVFRPDAVPSVGASGAILGLMGALVYFALSLPRQNVNWRVLLVPVAINLFYGFALRGIDNYAHIGGFLGGVLAAFLAGVPGERKPWRQVAMGATALVIVAVVVGVIPLPYLPLFR